MINAGHRNRKCHSRKPTSHPCRPELKDKTSCTKACIRIRLRMNSSSCIFKYCTFRAARMWCYLLSWGTLQSTSSCTDPRHYIQRAQQSKRTFAVLRSSFLLLWPTTDAQWCWFLHAMSLSMFNCHRYLCATIDRLCHIYRSARRPCHKDLYQCRTGLIPTFSHAPSNYQKIWI